MLLRSMYYIEIAILASYWNVEKIEMSYQYRYDFKHFFNIDNFEIAILASLI